MGSLLTDAEVDHADLAEALNGPPSGMLAIRAQSNTLTAGLADAFARFGQGRGDLLSPEDANRDYGVDGYVTFDRPTYADTAAARQHAGQRAAFRDDVLSRSKSGTLTKIGQALVGGLLDPAGLPVVFAPELLGMRGAIEGGAVFRAGGVLAKGGRVANAARYGVIGAAEGGVGTALYEGVNTGLATNDTDDHDFGQSLTNVMLGTVLGAGLGGVLGLASKGHPGAVRELSEDGRLGAAMLALDDAIADRPVKVADLIEREAPAAPERPRAPDDDAGAARISARELDTSVAVTSRGREIPVRYALVELADLKTSHDDDLSPNPAYPAALQPRDRTRAGSQAGNRRLEAELNPKRLMREPGAETGAPLIAPDGTVESGNGRAIALRRSARTGSEAYGRYTAELAAQGFDTAGMDRPVLVRIRSAAMSGEDRSGLAREMNAAPTEAMGPGEQAMADAASVDDAMLSHLDGTPAGERRFMLAFVRKIAPDQQNAFADAEGRLSQQGRQRANAALVARAYDDPRLVEAVFETADPNIRTLGAALTEAAAGWARLRSLAAQGKVPADLDVTAQLRAAIDLIRHARDNRIPVDEWIAQRLAAQELFGGGAAVDVETEAFLRLFFRDGTFKRHRSADRIAWALNDYARQASDVQPGANLFGDTPDGEARLILDGLAQRFARDEAYPGAADLLDLGPERPSAAGVDLRADAGDGGGAGLQRGGGEGAAAGVAEPGASKALDLIDPELRELAEQDLAAAGVVAPRDDPDTIAEAVRAAAFCLQEGGA